MVVISATMSVHGTSRAKATQTPEFEASEDVINWETENWKNLNEQEFNWVFKHSAVQRAGLQKN